MEDKIIKVVRYFETDPQDRQPLDSATISGEELTVAVEVDWGRRLVQVPHRYPTSPMEAERFRVAPPPEGERPCVYYDAISVILQAAAYEGLDPEELCRDALRTQNAVLTDAGGRSDV